MPMKKRTALSLLAAATAAAAAAAIPLTATGGPGVPSSNLPDLRSDAPEAVQVPEDDAGRLLLKFNGFVTNVGEGPLHLEGNPQLPPSDPNGPKQWAFDPDDFGNGPGGAGWTAVRSPEVLFETNDGHFHWHYMRISRYSLWNQARSAEVAPAQKVGFCLYDSEPARGVPLQPPIGGGYDGGGDFCRQDTGDLPQLGPNGDNDGQGIQATSVQMGVSPGYRDVYDWTLGLQWVDISNTAPGRYYLASQADPDNRVAESNENNPIAFMSETTVVPGYVPRAVGPVDVPFGGQADVILGASEFEHPIMGPLGQRVFRVTRAPRNGSLNVAAGSLFSSPYLVYTPKSGFGGVDSFEYEVRDATSRYPINAPRAAVTLNVGGNPSIAVVISGAPSRLIAGTSARLKAVVANGPQSVTWSVNNVVGGNAKFGTISANGLYRAPRRVPPGGRVVIRARSKANPTKVAGKAIRILPPRPPRPSFGRGGTVGEPIAVVGPGKATIRNLAKQAGRFRVEFRYGSRRFAVRSRSVRPGQVWAATARFPRNWSRKRIRIVSRFTGSSGARVVKVTGPTKLTALKVRRSGRNVVARTRTLRTGRITIVVRHGSTVLRRCRLTRLARGTAVCRATLRAGMRPGNVAAVAQLVSEDGLRAVKRGRL
jgi:hypothetical protein